MMLVGLATNLVVPLVFLALMVPALRAWHNPDEAATSWSASPSSPSMPIAGSSAGWAQAADGDMALSLGLVARLDAPEPADDARPRSTPWGRSRRAATARSSTAWPVADTGTFLAAWVLLPSVLGIVARSILGEDRAGSVERRLRVVAPVTLLVLCYSNASSCLPEALRRPDWDFLAIILTFVAGLCVVTFAAGYLLGRLLGADRGQRTALMFGLGMNNNGTGLVLASLALGSQPMVMLPIIVYNLTQHLVAGCVDALLRRGAPGIGGNPSGPRESVRIPTRPTISRFAPDRA